MLKKLVRLLLNPLGYDVRRIATADHRFDGIPDAKYYTPLFSPWNGYGDFSRDYSIASPYTLVTADRCYVLLTLARQAAALQGQWIECGVYRGGTAMMLAKAIHDGKLDTVLHVFDTFAGMPETDIKIDLHRKGDFADVSLREVKPRILSACGGDEKTISFHPGLIPDTFKGCGVDRISFAHVDVDIFSSVLDCCEFIYPRLVQGGFLVFDDYGFPTCPGARKAVDQFFADKPEIPLILQTGQAIIVKCRPPREVTPSLPAPVPAQA
jgi:O-methyltransferase